MTRTDRSAQRNRRCTACPPSHKLHTHVRAVHEFERPSMSKIVSPKSRRNSRTMMRNHCTSLRTRRGTLPFHQGTQLWHARPVSWLPCSLHRLPPCRCLPVTARLDRSLLESRTTIQVKSRFSVSQVKVRNHLSI